MTEEHLSKLWKQVEHIGEVDHFDDGRMLALGSVFGEMTAEINKQRKVLEFYADKNNYFHDEYGTSSIDRDFGQRARQALK